MSCSAPLALGSLCLTVASYSNSCPALECIRGLLLATHKPSVCICLSVCDGQPRPIGALASDALASSRQLRRAGLASFATALVGASRRRTRRGWRRRQRRPSSVGRASWSARGAHLCLVKSRQDLGRDGHCPARRWLSELRKKAPKTAHIRLFFLSTSFFLILPSASRKLSAKCRRRRRLAKALRQRRTAKLKTTLARHT